MLAVEAVDRIIKEVFSDAVVQSVKSVYETTDEENVSKLIISIHGLETGTLNEGYLIREFHKFLENKNVSTKIIHTKFIFYTNKEKTLLVDNKFSWLYDIDCVYKTQTFDQDSEESLKSNLDGILSENNFGDDIKLLSDFLNTPSRHINEYLQREKNIDSFSVYDIEYDPKFKIQPCKYVKFDFKINVNNIYEMNVNINKEDDGDYKATFKIGDISITSNFDVLINLPRKIGDALIQIMDKIQ